MMNNQTATSRTFPLLSALGMACVLSACGGGGGDDAAAPAPAPAPATSPVPAPGPNATQNAFNEGVYHLWGFNLILNNAAQTFISRQGIQAQGEFTVSRVAGATAAMEGVPMVFDPIESRYFTGGPSATSCTKRLRFSGTQATVGCVEANLASVQWAMQLNPVDVGGRRVSEFLRRFDGTPAEATRLAAPDTAFPAGAVAYLASFEAQADMVVVNGGEGIPGTTPVGPGWCQGVIGQTYKMGVALNADRTVSIFDVPGDCLLTRLVPVAIGSWQQVTVAGVAGYQLTLPEAFKAQPRWAPLFTSTLYPESRASLLLLNQGGRWLHATTIAKGDRYVNLQPHFNAAALPALKRAANLP